MLTESDSLSSAPQTDEPPNPDNTPVSPIELVTPVAPVSPLNPPQSPIPDYDQGFEIIYSPGSGSSQYPQFNYDPNDEEDAADDDNMPDSFDGIDPSPGDDFLYSDLYELDDYESDQSAPESLASSSSTYGATVPEPGVSSLLALVLMAAGLQRFRTPRGREGRPQVAASSRPDFLQ